MEPTATLEPAAGLLADDRAGGDVVAVGLGGGALEASGLERGGGLVGGRRGEVGDLDLLDAQGDDVADGGAHRDARAGGRILADDRAGGDRRRS